MTNVDRCRSAESHNFPRAGSHYANA
jgi:hypothetical protein